MKRIRLYLAEVARNLTGIPLLFRSAWKQLRYLAVVGRFTYHLPAMLREHEEGIQGLRRDMDLMGDYQANTMLMAKETSRMAADTHLRLRHHEHGPLMRSRVVFNQRQQQAIAAAAKLESKDPIERQAGEKMLAQLGELEAHDAIGPADVVIDAASGKESSGKVLQMPDRRLIIDETGG